MHLETEIRTMHRIAWYEFRQKKGGAQCAPPLSDVTAALLSVCCEEVEALDGLEVVVERDAMGKRLC